MADVPQIAVAAVDFRAAGFDRNAVLFRIVQTILARLQRPLPPGCDDLELGSKSLVGQFKAHLIVALPGATVRDGGGALAQRNFHLMLRDHRPRQRSPQQVFVLVDRSCLERGEHVAGQKLFAQVLDNDFAGAGGIGLLHHGLDVVALSHIADHGDDVIGIVFLEPRNNDRGVESAGIGKHNFLRHKHSLRAGARRRRAADIKSLFEREDGFPPAHKRSSGLNQSPRR